MGKTGASRGARVDHVATQGIFRDRMKAAAQFLHGIVEFGTGARQGMCAARATTESDPVHARTK